MVLLSMLAGILFTACEDELSVNNVLDPLQTIDVSIYVYDVVSDSSITNAEVTMILESGEETIITDELGIAYFTDVPISSNVSVSVEKEDYLKRDAVINIYTNDHNQIQHNANIALYSTINNTATIKGRLEIETNLTNDETEFVPEGTIIYAQINEIYGSLVQYVDTVGANGEYEFIVPADNYGVSYELIYPTIDLKQTIAINRIKGDPDFPETFPTIKDINTTYRPVVNALSIPFVPSIYAYVNTSATVDTLAVISEVVVDTNGSVIGLNWETGGYGYRSDSVDVVVVSLFDGSGAVIKVDVDEVSGGKVFTDLSSMKIHNSGSGYPTFSNANKVVSHSKFINEIYELKSGEIRILNGDYGTGTIRDQKIE